LRTFLLAFEFEFWYISQTLKGGRREAGENIENLIWTGCVG